jgi:RNA polymerase sigma factor (sigma-70 family)
MPDTTSQTADRAFPPTAWTIVLAAVDPTAPETLAAREELCRAYWQPVSKYLRALGMSVPDAEDGAQEIMTQLLGKEGLRQFDRERGRLRHYLKSSARHFVFNLHRDATALKRGGGVQTVSMEEVSESSHEAHEPESDSAFDKEWALTLCSRAMTSLEASYTRRNKSALLTALKPGLIFNDGLQPYAAIGLTFGVTEAQIRIEVHRMRRRLAEFLRAEVAGTLGPDATAPEIDAETRYLVKTLAHERRV